MFLMYNWSHSCTQSSSTCDGSLPPLSWMLPPRDTAAGKAFFLEKGAFPTTRRWLNCGLWGADLNFLGL